MNILAIESSCDETAAAVVCDGRQIKSNLVFSQIAEHQKYGGVVPEIASRRHVENISQVTYLALKEAGLTIREIDAVGVTYAPGLIGALLVGVNFAKGLAYQHHLPLVAAHHIRSHVAANYLAFKDLKPPFVCLIASGGHSHIALVEDYTKYRILGRTRDDAAGEAFDKVARVLGLAYPGGVSIDKLSKSGNSDAILFPQTRFKDAAYDFSFSGVKTSVIHYVRHQEQTKTRQSREDIAASFSRAVTNVLSEHTVSAALEYNVSRVALAGGVAANTMLREKISDLASKRDLTVYAPPIALCTDNAAMVASQAYYEFLDGNLSHWGLNGKSAAEIDDAE